MARWIGMMALLSGASSWFENADGRNLSYRDSAIPLKGEDICRRSNSTAQELQRPFHGNSTPYYMQWCGPQTKSHRAGHGLKYTTYLHPIFPPLLCLLNSSSSHQTGFNSVYPSWPRLSHTHSHRASHSRLTIDEIDKTERVAVALDLSQFASLTDQ